MPVPVSHYPIIIVGGGPVGAGLALELGQRGVRCLLVERYPEPQPIPKGQNLTQRTLEHFRAWGVEAAIRAARAMPADFPIGGITAYGDLMSPYWYPWLKRELVRPYYFADNERLPQYATERVLRRRLAAQPAVTARFGWEARHVEQDESGVRVELAEREGPGRTLVEADYLAGCDGSHSLVRGEAGIAVDEHDHERRMALLVFRSRELHERLERFPGKSFYCVLRPELQGYWQFFGRVDVGESWFFHAPVPAGAEATTFDFRALLHQAAGVAFACEFDHIGFWDLRVTTARRYRAGHIFIAGDACHSHPPYGGYGINTGLEDARNLGWKLAARLQGWGGEPLLDSYEAERRPVFLSTAQDFIEKMIRSDRDFLARHDPRRDQAAFKRAWAKRAAGASADVHAFEPHYEGSPVLFGPAGGRSSARGRHAFAARAGHHLAPQPLSGGRELFNALGPGFALLAFDAAAADIQAFRQAAQARGAPLQLVEDSYSGGRKGYEARLILVRPDHYVAWAGDRLEIPAATILARACGSSAGETKR